MSLQALLEACKFDSARSSVVALHQALPLLMKLVQREPHDRALLGLMLLNACVQVGCRPVGACSVRPRPRLWLWLRLRLRWGCLWGIVGARVVGSSRSADLWPCLEYALLQLDACVGAGCGLMCLFAGDVIIGRHWLPAA